MQIYVSVLFAQLKNCRRFLCQFVDIQFCFGRPFLVFCFRQIVQIPKCVSGYFLRKIHFEYSTNFGWMKLRENLSVDFSGKVSSENRISEIPRSKRDESNKFIAIKVIHTHPAYTLEALQGASLIGLHRPRLYALP